MTATTPTASTGLWGRWCATPLYLRIIGALVLGVVTGLLLGKQARFLEIPAQIILQLLGALAPPLILVAVTHVLMTTDIQGKKAVRLACLLILNTTVAILIGLGVANTLQPGKWTKISVKDEEQHTSPGTPAGSTDQGKASDKLTEEKAVEKKPAVKTITLKELITDNLPKSLLGPLGDKQNIIGVIIIAIALGISLNGVRNRPLTTVQDLVEIGYQTLLTMLHWIIQIVPIGVFAIVAKVIGTEGFGKLVALGIFVIAVLVALALQCSWYLLRIKYFSWPRPLDVVRGMRDALVMAFSTASSTVTMPVTYACLKENVGIREESASLGALVGANFNNDGTALYEAMAALFVAQLIGIDLKLWQQLLVVLTSILASVGAAGIPEAGLTTMTLVFTAAGLPLEYIALLVTTDWFLDRCRTTINVMGDVNVACMLDGKAKPVPVEAPTVAIEGG